VHDQHADLLETAVVEQEEQPLPCCEFSLLVLLLDPGFPASEQGFRPASRQIVCPVIHLVGNFTAK
jgi:hypothetical protein